MLFLEVVALLLPLLLRSERKGRGGENNNNNKIRKRDFSGSRDERKRLVNRVATIHLFLSLILSYPPLSLSLLISYCNLFIVVKSLFLLLQWLPLLLLIKLRLLFYSLSLSPARSFSPDKNTATNKLKTNNQRIEPSS